MPSTIKLCNINKTIKKYWLSVPGASVLGFGASVVGAEGKNTILLTLLNNMLFPISLKSEKKGHMGP